MNPTWTSSVHRALARRLAFGLLWLMVLAALAPAVSRALAAQRGGATVWVELCSSTGGLVRMQLPVDSPGTPGDAPVHTGLDACAYCLLAAEAFAPLSPAATLLPLAWGTLARPRAPAWAPVCGRAPLAAARGPPNVS
jgi:hypothetical protein